MERCREEGGTSKKLFWLVFISIIYLTSRRNIPKFLVLLIRPLRPREGPSISLVLKIHCNGETPTPTSEVVVRSTGSDASNIHTGPLSDLCATNLISFPRSVSSQLSEHAHCLPRTLLVGLINSRSPPTPISSILNLSFPGPAGCLQPTKPTRWDWKQQGEKMQGIMTENNSSLPKTRSLAKSSPSLARTGWEVALL